MGQTQAKCLSNVRLDGKTAIVTGSNTGIGKITAQDLFERGARVIMACRNVEKAIEAAEDIKTSSKSQQKLGEIIVTELDLSSLESVRDCAKRLLDAEPQINLLINNAGIMMCPESTTKDGYEMQFGTNHLGHFLFTLLLLPKIISSSPSRIVNVSSKAHEGIQMNFEDLNFNTRKYSALQAYKQSKLANVLFTKELARKMKDANVENVTVYSLHPGVIKTELGRYLSSTYNPLLIWGLQLFSYWVLISPEDGAQTSIHCAVDEEAGKETGLYYAECKVVEPSHFANSEEDAKKLWDISLKLVELSEDYNPFSVK